MPFFFKITCNLPRLMNLGKGIANLQAAWGLIKSLKRSSMSFCAWGSFWAGVLVLWLPRIEVSSKTRFKVSSGDCWGGWRIVFGSIVIEDPPWRETFGSLPWVDGSSLSFWKRLSRTFLAVSVWINGLLGWSAFGNLVSWNRAETIWCRVWSDQHTNK